MADTSRPQHTPESARQNLRCVVAAIREYPMCGPENVQAEARTRALEGQVLRLHRCHSHFEFERGVVAGTIRLVSSLVD